MINNATFNLTDDISSSMNSSSSSSSNGGIISNDSSSSGDGGSTDSSSNFGFYIEGLVLTAVATFGLVGNCLSIIVLFQKSFRSSFSNLLRGLAYCDALFLIMAILSFGLPQLTLWYKNHVFMHMAPVIFGLLHTCRVGSVYVTMAGKGAQNPKTRALDATVNYASNSILSVSYTHLTLPTIYSV